MNLYFWTGEYSVILLGKAGWETGREKTHSGTFLYFDNSY